MMRRYLSTAAAALAALAVGLMVRESPMNDVAKTFAVGVAALVAMYLAEYWLKRRG
jgi:hypothetical protein